MTFVRIGLGITVGLDRETKSLQLILLEGLEKQQELFGVKVSEKSHGSKFMEILNSLHLLYYEDLEVMSFVTEAESKLASVGRSIQDRSVLERLIKTYTDDLVLQTNVEL